jgi:hypothetical protein
LLMNHPFVMKQARRAAERVLDEGGADDANRIEQAYLVTLGRPPSTGERTLASRFIRQTDPNDKEQRIEAWTQFFQALIASIDFRYLN